MGQWRDSTGGSVANSVLNGTSIPLILPSSGTIGNNGALSAITALPLQYAACYMYFPSNAIAAGVAAGMYYVVMSSTTAGTIYNNTYTSGTPVIPASPTAFATTGPGAYTQTTAAQITLFSDTIPGGIMGISGTLHNESLISTPANANNKTSRLNFGGTTVQQIVQAGASALSQIWHTDITNRGHASRQIVNPLAVVGTSSASASNFGNTSIDTSVDVTYTFTAELAVATDYIILQGIRSELSLLD